LEHSFAVAYLLLLRIQARQPCLFTLGEKQSIVKRDKRT